jgi:hypothetical protein
LLRACGSFIPGSLWGVLDFYQFTMNLHTLDVLFHIHEYIFYVKNLRIYAIHIYTILLTIIPPSQLISAPFWRHFSTNFASPFVTATTSAWSKMIKVKDICQTLIKRNQILYNTFLHWLMCDIKSTRHVLTTDSSVMSCHMNSWNPTC